MTRNPAGSTACPNEHCSKHGKLDHGNIVLHGYSKL